MPEKEINIAEEVAGWYVMYPDEFDDCRQRWLEFIRTGDTTDEYKETVTEQVKYMEESNVPGTDRIDVIVASFMAASADSALNRVTDEARHSAGNLRRVLNNIW